MVGSGPKHLSHLGKLLWHLSHLDAIFIFNLDQICGLPTGSSPCENPQQHQHLFFKSISWTRHKPRILNIININVPIALSMEERC